MNTIGDAASDSNWYLNNSIQNTADTVATEPVAVAASLDEVLTHTYPASLFTVDRSRPAASPDASMMGWWKTENIPVWRVLVVLGDVCHLRSFSRGIYISGDYQELWNASLHYWLPWASEPITKSIIFSYFYLQF